MKSYVKEKCVCKGSALGLGSNKNVCMECGGSGELLRVKSDSAEKLPVKQFSELTASELQELRQALKDRAKKEGRELLDDVVCVWRPMPGCTCGCNSVGVV